jgi:hypothetical protein
VLPIALRMVKSFYFLNYAQLYGDPRSLHALPLGVSDGM